jgi:hypothetical protein
MSSELKWARNFNRFMFGTIVTGILWCPFVVATVISINLETGSFDLYHLPGSLESGFQWSCVVTLFEHLCWQSLTHDIFLILIRFMWASVVKALHDCRHSGDVNHNPVSWPLWSMRLRQPWHFWRMSEKSLVKQMEGHQTVQGAKGQACSPTGQVGDVVRFFLSAMISAGFVKGLGWYQSLDWVDSCLDDQLPF